MGAKRPRDSSSPAASRSQGRSASRELEAEALLRDPERDARLEHLAKEEPQKLSELLEHVTGEANAELCAELVHLAIERLDLKPMRQHALRLTGAGLWELVSAPRLEARLRTSRALARQWQALQLQEKGGGGGGGGGATKAELEAFWGKILGGLFAAGSLDAPVARQVLRLVLLVLQSPGTRRFAALFIRDVGLVARCKRLPGDPWLLRAVQTALDCGDVASDEQLDRHWAARVRLFERVGLRHFEKDLGPLVLAPCAQAARDIAAGAMDKLPDQTLRDLCNRLGLLQPSPLLGDDPAPDRELLLSLLHTQHERPLGIEAQLAAACEPAAQWEFAVEPLSRAGLASRAATLERRSAALRPRLQYHSEHAFLASQCELLCVQSQLVLARELEAAAQHLGAVVEAQRVSFPGWSRMALPATLESPSTARVDIAGCPAMVLSEWAALRGAPTPAVLCRVTAHESGPRFGPVFPAHVTEFAGDRVALRWATSARPRDTGTAQYILVRRAAANDGPRQTALALCGQIRAAPGMRVLPAALAKTLLGQASVAAEASGVVLLETRDSPPHEAVLDRVLQNAPERTLVIAASESVLDAVRQHVEDNTMLRVSGVRRADLDASVQRNLARRLELLEQANEIAAGLAVRSGRIQTCEMAQSLFELYVRPELERYMSSSNGAFPLAFFFGGRDAADTRNKHEIQIVTGLFEELLSLRMFEILLDRAARVRYVLERHAQVLIATPAEVLELLGARRGVRLHVERIAFLEASQTGHSAALAALALCEPSSVVSLVACGDALAPVAAPRSHGIFLFERLARLGRVPEDPAPASDAISPWPVAEWAPFAKPFGARLGREAARLLGSAAPRGLARACQLVDTGGAARAQLEPAPGQFQDLAEAEFVVAAFHYLVLIGYPAGAIALLTPFHAQRLLLLDILHARGAAGRRIMPFPGLVATLDDEMAAEGHEVVLVSLARSSTDGALRLREAALTLRAARGGVLVFGAACALKAQPLWGPGMEPRGLLLRLGELFGDDGKSGKEHEVRTARDMAALVAHLRWQSI